MYAYVDETGNTGQNIFDEAQPYFMTAALTVRSNFDILCRSSISKIARRIESDTLHASELGPESIEEVASDILYILKKFNPRFILCRVEKKYLATTKIVDHIFDSGENLAVPWHIYNIRLLRIMMVFKVSLLIDTDLAKEFWAALMEPKQEVGRSLFVNSCNNLLSRVSMLPDNRSQEVVTSVLTWAIENPEAFSIFSKNRLSRYMHLPNTVAFVNLLDGLERQSIRWNKPVKLIVHDEQVQFEKNLKLYHELYSNANPEPFYWPGEEPRTVRVVHGSKFAMSRSTTSAGIQVIDTVLWLYKRLFDQKPIGPDSASLLQFAMKRTWYQDLSFEFVGRQVEQNFDKIFSTDLSEEQMKRAAEMLKFEDDRRTKNLTEYAASKQVPGQGKK